MERNKLTGSIPAELVEKSESGLLSLRYICTLSKTSTNQYFCKLFLKLTIFSSTYASVGDNPNLCASVSCDTNNPKEEKKKKNSVIIPIVASVGGVLILLLIAAVILVVLKRKRKPGNDSC